MPNAINKKQQVSGFIWLLASFFVIFSILASVIFVSYTRTVFNSADSAINQTLSMYDSNGLLSTSDKDVKKPQPLYNNTSTRTETWLFDKNGKLIIDSNTKDTRQAALQKALQQAIKFDKVTMTVKPNTYKFYGNYYRIIGFQFKKNAAKGYNQIAVHGMVTVNVTDTMDNLNNFKKVLFWSFGLFGILLVIVSYLIARRNMKPILKSWQQQQDFVNNAAHELRTPMAVIQGKLETMLTKPESTVRDQSNAIILSLSEVRRLNSLTNNMLTLAKTGSNMTTIEKESTDVKQFLENIITPYQEMAEFEEKAVTLEVDVNQAIFVDQKRIHQLLVLLLDNALKYSDAGATIAVKAGIEKKKFVLTIADSGRGISDEAKKHVFDRFYREDKTGNRQTGGTGLGLSIAEWVVHAHGGKITVADNQPQGTVFKVILPL
ncbi:HAMP domain-containing histidine kinase [Leuconostoc mesenteroides]|uniref:sensor histidine kinase n=1 Tax=Leuconostoc mesenteroides TaxID=1245 RepID=UPI001CBA7159|nr:HAMP domain-containing sensor histidine kinase [Leuconostoc mesenteroides]MBZ1516411.1 HAMP domain-containing histidine kinase [Leuconostoc mesenteroides]